MPLLTNPQCPKCKAWLDVYVAQDLAFAADERFEYDCPKCDTRVNDALRVFTPIGMIPAGATVATKAVKLAIAAGPAALPATTDITITVTCAGADTINKVLPFPGQVQVTRQVVSDWNASVAFRDANGVWRTWRVQPTPQDAAAGLLPNHGPSTLTIKIEATGANTFSDQFVYQVQFAEWYVLQPPSQERGVNFIPIAENGNWWKWSLT